MSGKNLFLSLLLVVVVMVDKRCGIVSFVVVAFQEKRRRGDKNC